MARHGTPSGYNAHRRTGEQPCDACARAKSDYDKRRSTTPDRVRRGRLAAAAQGRAKTRLVALYPELYRALYLDEKARLMAEQDDT
jgi:hypothetical protein